jgi:hypothetical protein
VRRRRLSEATQNALCDGELPTERLQKPLVRLLGFWIIQDLTINELGAAERSSYSERSELIARANERLGFALGGTALD